MLGVGTDPTFNPLLMRHDLMIEATRLEKAIGQDVKVPSDAASPSAVRGNGTKE